MNGECRRTLLEEAEELVRAAHDLVLKATAGTDVEVQGREVAGRMIATVVSDAESIMTLKKNLSQLPDGGPGWTRPLVSVKEAGRRDI